MLFPIKLAIFEKEKKMAGEKLGVIRYQWSYNDNNNAQVNSKTTAEKSAKQGMIEVK